MIISNIQNRLLTLIEQMPVFTVTGPRQSGKTTLVKSLYKDYGYFNLELPISVWA